MSVPDDMEKPGEREDGADTTILLFDTTHASIAAEEAIIDAGFWCDVVPKPPDAMTGLCGLAIKVRLADLDGVRKTLRTTGLGFEIYQPEVEAF